MDRKLFNNGDSKSYSLWDKIWWRIKFLLFESWGKDLEIIFFSLFSAENRGAKGLVNLLSKKKIIELNKENNFFRYNQYLFFYNHGDNINSCIADFVSIWSSKSKCFFKNFIQSGAYYFEGPYEYDKLKLEDGDYVIDAGANIGIFSILASEKVGARGRVFSFEPIKETRAVLCKNITYNNLINIQIVPFALGDNNKKLEFMVSNIPGQSSGYYENTNNKKEMVEQKTLDDFVKINEIKKVNFIKADIEGMERNLLIGAKETIEKFKPKISVCTYHRPDDSEIIEEIIKNYVPTYNILKTKAKLYAWPK